MPCGRGRGAKRKVAPQLERGPTRPSESPCQPTNAHSQPSARATGTLEGVNNTTNDTQGMVNNLERAECHSAVDQEDPFDEGGPLDEDGPSDEDDPLCDTAESSRSNVAFDAHYFFYHTPDKEAWVCKQCKSAHKKDPAAWAAKYPRNSRKFSFSGNNSTTSLQPHIERFHLLEYVTKVEQEGWPIRVQSVVTTIDKGYTISQIRQAIAAGQDLSCLPR
ncbi:hypothetical protein BJV78DRAFT_1159337 [Lactifluus subvellereus]|nr:hypothetical protein BJV78DRAFT_1159337 [Lactifluus subvellereus]